MSEVTLVRVANDRVEIDVSATQTPSIDNLAQVTKELGRPVVVPVFYTERRATLTPEHQGCLRIDDPMSAVDFGCAHSAFTARVFRPNRQPRSSIPAGVSLGPLSLSVTI